MFIFPLALYNGKAPTGKSCRILRARVIVLAAQAREEASGSVKCCREREGQSEFGLISVQWLRHYIPGATNALLIGRLNSGGKGLKLAGKTELNTMIYNLTVVVVVLFLLLLLRLHHRPFFVGRLCL